MAEFEAAAARKCQFATDFRESHPDTFRLAKKEGRWRSGPWHAFRGRTPVAIFGAIATVMLETGMYISNSDQLKSRFLHFGVCNVTLLCPSTRVWKK
ncbi:hypothetical protein [Maritalea sp. S77]|uniref:hypothetical protein n=1 Tax=Maritalea sp. S77 TaxID=3415125 RepID=UPI003C7ADE0A